MSEGQVMKVMTPRTSDDAWLRACAGWTELLGPEQVLTDPDQRRAAQTATFATDQRVPVILRPATRAEVQGCLRVATACGVALYPSSRGCNWGLGSRVPVEDRCGVLDLGRMNRIVDFCEDMGTLTIEPGVTFEQVVEFLDQQGSRYFFNITGSSPWSSPLANALERGDGVGPYGDRVAHTCGLEVVLPDGRVVHTGMSRFDRAATATLHRWGVGPSLDGLFAQSNLGVVTRMTFWLKPRPGVLQIARFRVDDPAGLAPLIDAMRQLRLEGTLGAGAGIWNDFRAFSARGLFPWEHQTPPLTREDLGALMPEGGAWFGLTTLYSAHIKQAEGNAARLHEVLGPVTDTLAVAFQTQGSEEIRDLLLEGSPSTLAPFGDVSTAFAMMSGRPSVASQRSMYWRKRDATPGFQSPERDRCGVIWACPLIPLHGPQVAEASRIVEQLISAHGFEPLFSWVVQHERVAYFIILLIYDRDVEGDDARAMACHDAILDACIARGWIPWRLGIHSMDALPEGRGDTDALVRELKQLLDPSGVLAPGRYIGG
ncbi:4-cresol dehydrogenase [hydroxylating] flavoprotein subunit [Enhygromyxa salina]|uniref:4-cresol dehydrogenase [hydroxylating] flavoprotein subunit n=1 Tax=Enhygromyxa salina TaxID=215803 RepID=A0A2S9XYE9_9BACT|nr:FAD-binding oxidoreductase [Enhygromyxa salina]PRP97884.1 4-cresol dehydrogenase [hydroxylating] flavoprotein subunit [Enhygromyxa salina]